VLKAKPGPAPEWWPNPKQKSQTISTRVPMTSKKNISFIHVFFIILILITTLSITIIGYLWISSEYTRFRQKSQQIRSDFIASRKALIKGEVLSAVDFIDYKRSQTEQRLRQDIKKRTYEAHAIATNIHSQFKGQKRPDEIAELIKEALRPIRFNDGRGYYFAVSMDGVEQLYPIRPEFEGVNLLKCLDMHLRTSSWNLWSM